MKQLLFKNLCSAPRHMTFGRNRVQYGINGADTGTWKFENGKGYYRLQVSGIRLQVK